MKRLLAYFSCLLIVFGASMAFAGVYFEDFEDDTIEAFSWIEGEYEIMNGALHMFDGEVTWVRLRANEEFVYHFEADVKISSDNNHLAGIAVNWWIFDGPDWTFYSTGLQFSNGTFQANLFRETEEGPVSIGDPVIIGVGAYDVWHSLSITVNEDNITFVINNNTPVELFHGMYPYPNAVSSGEAMVGSNGEVSSPNYYADNLLAYTRLNPAKFDYVALLSEVRQYDPARYLFDEDSVWYNGNPYRLIMAWAGTSGEPPVYPVYLDAPIYSDTSNYNPLELYSEPNYVTHTNFSDYALFPYRGFESPGPAWENKNYKFFIDANGNGMFDTGETNEDWFIPENSLIEMDLINNLTITGGIHPTFSWDSVPLAEMYMVNFYSILDTGFPDFSVRLHTSGYIYEPNYTYTGDLFSNGQEYAIYIQARDFHPDPGPWGMPLNRTSYFTKYHATDEILESLTEWVDSGELVGTGAGQSAEGRLRAFENMLHNSRDLFNNGDFGAACDQLNAAYEKCDGLPAPPDFVEGDATEDMRSLIESLMADFQCG
jgi:hypothetical protein